MSLKQEIVFELLAHEDLKMFQEFIRNHWGKNHIFAQEASIFDWQHKGPHSYHNMVVKQNRNLIGVHGVIPLNHFDRHLPNNQIFIALWRILEGKGIGIGLQMFKNILAEYNPEFIAGLPMNPRVHIFYKRQGFKIVALNHHVVLSTVIQEFKIAKVPEGRKAQKIKNSASFQKLTKTQLKKLKTDLLYLYQLPLKSDLYIINRYLNHPVYNYEVYAIFKESMVQALCVIRPIYKGDSVVINIVDFIGPNEAFPLSQNLIMFLLNVFNAEYVDFYSHGIPLHFIDMAGFINRKKIKDLIVPSHFEPYENKNIEIWAGYYSSQNNIPVRIFKGDGDADRPSEFHGRNKCQTS